MQFLPPADALVGKWLRDDTFGEDAIFLTYHVDYWNYIGWTDPYASESHSQRQYAYAAAMGEGGVYTPQLVVDGRAHTSGARRGAARKLVSGALQARAKQGARVRFGEIKVQRLDARNQKAKDREGGTEAPSKDVMLDVSADASADVSVNVSVTVQNAPQNTIVRAAFAEDHRRNVVPRGENAGRTLHSAAVVRALSSGRTPKNKAQPIYG